MSLKVQSLGSMVFVLGFSLKDVGFRLMNQNLTQANGLCGILRFKEQGSVLRFGS